MNKVVRSVAWMALTLGLIAGSGCLSDNPGSVSMAYVDIESFDQRTVQGETIQVFKEQGYRLVAQFDEELTFERIATQRDRIRLGSYGEKDVIIRVVVLVEPRIKGGTLLRADAFSIRNGYEERLARIGRRPYQSLLNQVKKNLEGIR